MTTDEKLLREIFAAQGKSFRGSVLDFIKDAPMVKGHGNDGKPFDIETACYLKPVFAEYDKARANGTRLLLMMLAGIKTVKSFTAEAMSAEHVCNGAGDFAIYFKTEDAKDMGSTTRIMDYMKGIPLFSKKLETVGNRFGDTKGAIKCPDKTFFLMGANLPNTAQKNLGGLALQDGYLLEKNGMLSLMLGRTTQYHDEAIIILESQGGETGFDFDNKWIETDQREIYVQCPHCGSNHIFNWKAWDLTAMRRADDFIPKPPLIIPSLDHVAWIEHNRPLMMDETRRIAGFQRGDEKLIKRSDGTYDENAIYSQTHFRCYHCDGIWKDDGRYGATRIALDRSSNYIAANPGAIVGNVGFNFPQWINTRLSWGEMMVRKLNAQKASEQGNFGLLKDWWQQVAAKTWDEEQHRRRLNSSVEVGSYETNPEKLSFPPEIYHSRKMTVDCGKAEGLAAGAKVISKLFFEIRDWSKTGDSKQMARGMVESTTPGLVWDLLAAQQKYWKVPCRKVFIDSGWMPSQVMEAAAKHFELVPPGKSFQLPSTWRLLLGSQYKRFGKASLPYVDERIPGVWRAHDSNGKLWPMGLMKITWSNYVFEDQLVRILLKTSSAKWENLPKEKVIIIGMDGTPDAELTRKYLDFERDTQTMFRSWDSGLDSRYLDAKTGKYLDTYKGGHWTEPRDLALMQLVGAALDGLLGHVGITASPESSQV